MPEVTKPTRRVTRCMGCGERGYDFVEYPRRFTEANRDTEGVILCPECIRWRSLMKCDKCERMFYHNRSWKAVDVLMYPNIAELCEGCGNEHKAVTPPRPVKECRACGRWVLESDLKDDMCNSCYKLYMPCPICAKGLAKKTGRTRYVRVGDKRKEETLDPMCSVCFAKMYGVCELCQSVSKLDSMVGKVCQHCYDNSSGCELCFDREHNDRLQIVENKRLCRDCRATRVRTCDTCEVLKIDCGAKYHWHHDPTRQCSSCIDSPVQNYNFKRPPIFYGKGKLFFGIENEYEFKQATYKQDSDALREWTAKEPNLYHLMYDGTLKWGLELVTMPGTFEFWRDRGLILPTHIPNDVARGTAGCHIHMSKNAFLRLHLYKFLSFLTINFENFVNVFGRGIGNKYDQIGERLIPYAKDKSAPTKYWWLNLYQPNTLEVRIFLAAETNAQVYSYLQLLHSVYMYTLDRTPKAVDWKEYYLWLKQQKDYSLLAEQLDKKPKPEKYVVPIKGEPPANARMRRTPRPTQVFLDEFVNFGTEIEPDEDEDV